MEYVILGLLLLRSMTAYEVRGQIRQHFQSICSDSLGTIQSVLKKLLQAGCVEQTEVSEKKLLKKYYHITAQGADYVSAWLQSPIDMGKTKNMDLAKLLFMGMVPKLQRKALLAQSVEQMQAELAALHGIKAQIALAKEKQAVLEYLQENNEKKNLLLSVSEAASLSQAVEDIAFFEMAALDYGIASLEFHLDWFQKLSENLE